MARREADELDHLNAILAALARARGDAEGQDGLAFALFVPR